MAGQLNLFSGAAPTAAPSSGISIYTPSGANDANGLKLDRRVLAMGTLGEILQLSHNSRINYIRNGGFWFAQRQAAGTPTTYSNTSGRAISADGWGITNENASATYARVDTSGGILAGYQAQYYGEFLKTTSTGKLVVSQVIEGLDSIFMRNRRVRFTAWLRGAGGFVGTLRMGVLYLTGAGTVDTIPATFVSAFGAVGTDPTFGANIAKCTGATVSDGGSAVTGNALSVTMTASWQRVSVSVLVPNDAKNLIPTIWTDGQPAATTGFDVGQVSFTDGDEIQDWSPLPVQTERQRILRYYQKSFRDATAPAQNAGTGTGEVRAIAGKAGAAAEFIPIQYPVPFLIPPTLTLYNPNAANAQVRDVTAGADCSASAPTSSDVTNFYVSATGNAGTAVGNLLSVHYTADGEL
jgi:hypothetical protein